MDRSTRPSPDIEFCISVNPNVTDQTVLPSSIILTKCTTSTSKWTFDLTHGLLIEEYTLLCVTGEADRVLLTSMPFKRFHHACTIFIIEVRSQTKKWYPREIPLDKQHLKVVNGIRLIGDTKGLIVENYLVTNNVSAADDYEKPKLTVNYEQYKRRVQNLHVTQLASEI